MENLGIGRWVARKAERQRDAIAIVHRNDRIAYGALSQRIDRLAEALAGRGVRPGDRVAYLGNNHPAFLETLFATATLGAIFVPLNTRLAPPEIEFMLADSGTSLLVFHDELRELARAGSHATGVRQRIVVEGEGEAGVERYEAVLASAEAAPRDVPVGLDDAAVILYTSGTTGHPKGAVITHGNFHWNSFNVMVDYGVSPGERVLLISPMFHVASLSNGALAGLLQGGTVVLHEKFDPAHVLETIECERITMLAGVPTTFQMLQEHPHWERADISSLQRLTCGGSAVPERLMEAFGERGLGFSVGYGMTETSPGATALPRIAPGTRSAPPASRISSPTSRSSTTRGARLPPVPSERSGSRDRTSSRSTGTGPTRPLPPSSRAGSSRAISATSMTRASSSSPTG